MSGGVTGGAFGILQGARAASKLKMVMQLLCGMVSFALNASAVLPKDAFQPSFERHGQARPRVGG